MLRWRILGILHENNDEAVAGGARDGARGWGKTWVPRRWAAMPPVRHRAVAQAALAATGARTAVTEDDAIHCITSHTVAHRVCIPNGWLGGQSRKVTHGNRLDC